MAGGIDKRILIPDYPLGTTQCYDLTTGGASWTPENDILGSLPVSWWGMGYTQRPDPDPQLWLVGGVHKRITVRHHPTV